MATGTNGIATVADVLSISGVTVSGSYTSSQCVKYSDIKGVSWPTSSVTFEGDLQYYQSHYNGTVYIESEYNQDLIGDVSLSIDNEHGSNSTNVFMPVDDVMITISTRSMLVSQQADEFRITVKSTKGAGSPITITTYKPSPNSTVDITSSLRSKTECQYMVELPGTRTAVKVYRPIIVELFAIG